MKKYLGEIEFTKGHLTVTDPCYKPGTWCTGKVENVFKGTWEASMEVLDCGDWGKRIASLTVKAKGQNPVRSEKLDADIGVDAGICGVFEDKPDLDSVWGSLCDEFFFKARGGIAEPNSLFKCAGAWSESGYGDGSYDATVGYNEAGEVVEVTIDYGVDEDGDYTDESEDDKDDESEAE